MFLRGCRGEKFLLTPLKPLHGGGAQREVRVENGPTQQFKVRGWAMQFYVMCRLFNRLQRRGSIPAVHDEFAEKRIVIRRHRVTGGKAEVGASHRTGRQRIDPPRTRLEPIPRILRVNPELDGVPGELHVLLLQRQRFAGGDAELEFDQVQAGDHLCDRVFDLEPGVHFEEIDVRSLTPPPPLPSLGEGE
ncbi:hypothetical protein [Candidatus Amarobacter glycogenicus]|uniref:hypothetical protein n=1 Tax=Candidatus Amarobacter glycogenicus TaxID=3140699 RepID=UPI0031CC6DFE